MTYISSFCYSRCLLASWKSLRDMKLGCEILRLIKKASRVRTYATLHGNFFAYGLYIALLFFATLEN